MTAFSSISFSNIKNEVERYLREEHNKASLLYSPASPYGQVLAVIENLHQLSLLYLKNTISQLDLNKFNSTNERVIKNTAILAGHIPFRSISSTGTIRLIKKTSIDIEKELPSGVIVLNNKTKIKNKTNNLFYSFNIGKFKLEYNVNNTKFIPIPIIQGEWKSQVFTDRLNKLG